MAAWPSCDKYLTSGLSDGRFDVAGFESVRWIRELGDPLLFADLGFRLVKLPKYGSEIQILFNFLRKQSRSYTLD